MATITGVGKQRFLANLRWRAVQRGADVDRRVSAILGEEKADYGVVYDVEAASGEAVRVIGMIPKSEYDPTYSGVPSLAAAVASRIPDGYIVAPLNGAADPSRWWLCGFNSGAVRPGTDIVGHKDTIIQALRTELMAVEDAALFAANGAGDAMLSLGREVVSADLESLTRAGDSTRKVSRLKSQTLAIAAVVLGAGVAVFAAGYLLHSLFFGEDEYAQSDLSPEEVERLAREAFIAARGAQVDKILSTSNNFWVHDAKSYIFDLPRLSNGYEMEKALCGPEGTCSLKYTAGVRPSLTGFRQDFEWRATGGTIVFPMDGATAELTVRYSDANSRGAKRQPEYYEAVPDHKDFVQQLVTRMQRLGNIMPNGWSRTLSNVKPLGLGVPNPFGAEYYTGSITVSMEQLWLFEHITNAIASQYVSIQKVEILNRPSPSIKLDANYVIAKYPEKK